MLNVALIKNKKVENVVVFETLQDAVSMLPLIDMDMAVEVNGGCNIGDVYENNTFSTPAPEPSEMEIKLSMLDGQIKALTEQNETLENALLEMAAIVYA